MFGIGPLEAIAIVALALIVLGPQKFPEAGRALGKMIREFRSVTDDLTRDFKINYDDDTPATRRSPVNAVSRGMGLDDTPQEEQPLIVEPVAPEPILQEEPVERPPTAP